MGFTNFNAFRNRSVAISAMVSACGIGAFLYFSPIGDPLVRLSFDLPFLFRPSIGVPDLIIVTMNDGTYGDPDLNAKYNYPHFDRSTHAKFLQKLASDDARLVVFDIFFADPMPEDEAFASAITNHGNVVLASEIESLGDSEFVGTILIEPASALRDLPGCRIALADLRRDTDLIVRQFPREDWAAQRLPFVAAAADGSRIDPPAGNGRWVGYYGDEGTLPSEPYQFAMQRPAGYFKNKVVFIGGKPKIDHLLAKSDEFGTALTRWTGNAMRGVELHATMFLNLIRKEWLTRLPLSLELPIVLVAGLVFGSALTLFRPVPGLAFAGLSAILVALAAIALFWLQRIWFNWTLIAGIQIPVAWACSAIVYSHALFREKETLKRQIETIKAEETKTITLASKPPLLHQAVDPELARPAGSPVLPDYELLKKIGGGSYGEVWLGRSLTGAYRAIKVVYRKSFADERPFEREFKGVLNFEPISRSHPGWVSILHVGKDDRAGYFYYVMEPADDLMLGPQIHPQDYVPKTLGKWLVEENFLPIDECVEIGINLANALGALHERGLIHRDVKPSNIIFVNSMPKLADIGLVVQMDDTISFVGTEHFIPPEGPGTPLADIFSLGRVLYQTATGCDPSRHPGLPTSLGERKDARELMLLMEIINKACERSSTKRYQSAGQLRDDLASLELSPSATA
jgi:CHASE2 domain-containing sensor protein